MANWQAKAAAKAAEAKAKIPAEWLLPEGLVSDDQLNVLDVPRTCGILTPEELSITEDHDATALRDKLAKGELTAFQVTVAFCKRSAIAQQLTSCLTETMYDMALVRAKQLDDYLNITGKTVGPLHGVPISLKETFNVEGVHSSMGLVCFLDNPPASQNSALVDILLAAGAVLYVKTNIPQLVMTADSHNNVFGRTLNPHRRNLTAGGSSGGEGALLAMRGSVLGIGTDIAGSIRIPALCCGVVGFKPSVGRIPYAGQMSAARPGMLGIAPCAGPLCHTLRDAQMLLQVVCNSPAEDLDDGALNIKWDESFQEDAQRLTIGVLTEDPKYPLHPNMKRALRIAMQKLEAAGHTIVGLTGVVPDMAPDIARACDIAFSFFRIDPDNTGLKRIASTGEPEVPSLQYTHPYELRDKGMSMRDLLDLNAARGQIIAQMRKMFVNGRLDLVIGPGYQSCAPPHDQYGNAPYTVLANLVDYPACVIPFEKAVETDDASFIRDRDYVPPYRPKEVEGAPCHVQLIGRRLKDEKLMQAAQIVERVLART